MKRDTVDISIESSDRDRELVFKSLLLDATSDGIIAHTPDGRLTYVNEAASRQLGCTVVSAAALAPWEWLPGDARPETIDRVARIMEQGESRFETQHLCPCDASLHAEIHARLVETDDGPLIVWVCRDISARVAAEKQMRQLAFHDELTGLANRTALEEHLRSAIAAADRHDDLVGVVYLDLDDFKPVNDTFGHAMGDKVLKVVAHRLASCVRESDTVARLGGDEFMVLFPRLKWRGDLAAAACKLSDLLALPISINGHEIRVSASLGLALYEKGEAPDELATRADHEMYRAKQNGLPGWQSFLSEE